MNVEMHYHRGAVRALVILSALADRPYSAPQLEEVASFSVRTNRTILSALEREGFVERLPSLAEEDRGRY